MDTNTQDELVLNLTPDPKVLIALTHTHIQPLDALCELIDNAIDSFSSATLQGLNIILPTIRIDLPKPKDIEANKGVVRISDNGPGMSASSAEKALRAGFSGNNPYDTLGLFGMGFNISTGKIGSITHFYSASEDDDMAVDVIIDLNKINESKDYRVTAYRKDKGSMKHGTIIEIYNWWPNGNDNRGFIKTLLSYGAKKIRDELGRRYATILRKNEIKIIVNEIACEPFEHCVWADNRFVERQKHGKIPAVFRFNEVVHTQKKCLNCTATLESFQSQCPSCGSNEIRTIEEKIRGWVGIQRYDDLSEFGIDLIRNGRAIRISEKSAFFEYVDEFQKVLKDYPIDSNFGRIVGEVHIDHVPVDFMKQDFQRSSPEWHRAITFLRGNSSLQPTQPGADKNQSPIFKLFQGYRKVKTAGRTDMYMGTWDPVKEEPRRISRDVEKEYILKFKNKEPGYYTDEEWWKKVEEADKKPVKQMPLCPVCGCQNLEEADVCIACQHVLKGKECISCGETIPLSAKSCPVCGTSQEVKILKPWICNICGTKNQPKHTICAECGAARGEENHLSIEYLLKNSDKNDDLSINDCSVILANGNSSAPLSVNVHEARMPIKSNFEDKSLPVFTIKQSLNEIYIFIDSTHRMFKGCGVRIEQIVAGEVAEYIYMLNKAISKANGKHTIPFIAWQIVEKYWADKMDVSGEDLNGDISVIVESIKERLLLSSNDSISEHFDLLTNEETKEMVNEMLNAGEDITKIDVYRQNLHFLHYVPLSYIVRLFDIRPEFFFDGSVWDEPYYSIDTTDEIKRFTQERTKALYKGCLQDLLYYMTYKSQSDTIVEKTKIAIQLLKQKVVE